jgi:hypothetical protein
MFSARYASPAISASVVNRWRCSGNNSARVASRLITDHKGATDLLDSRVRERIGSADSFVVATKELDETVQRWPADGGLDYWCALTS